MNNSNKKSNWKLLLIIIGIVFTVILCGAFAVNTAPNKAINLSEQITTAKSTIKIQEKRRADLIPNLVDCVKQYDKHEYETLMAVVNGRNIASDDKAAREIKTMINAVAESYPELKSSSSYKELMNELATTENKIASTRENYNAWVTKYNTHCKKFPNRYFLEWVGYEIQEFKKIDFDVSEDAPTNLFN